MTLNIFVDLGGISVTRLSKGGVDCVEKCFILDWTTISSFSWEKRPGEVIPRVSLEYEKAYICVFNLF